MEWVAVNVGDGHRWDDWRITIDNARASGVLVFPWMRCLTYDDVERLLATSDLVAFQSIVNIEDEFQGAIDPRVLANLLKAYDAELDVAISTVGWVYNNVDYSPLSGIPFLLQLFPTDMRRDPSEFEQIQKDCCLHARERGVVHCGVTYQTYGDAKPEWWSYWKGARSYYTGDDIGKGGWDEWSV